MSTSPGDLALGTACQRDAPAETTVTTNPDLRNTQWPRRHRQGWTPHPMDFEVKFECSFWLQQKEVMIACPQDSTDPRGPQVSRQLTAGRPGSRDRMPELDWPGLGSRAGSPGCADPHGSEAPPPPTEQTRQPSPTCVPRDGVLVAHVSACPASVFGTKKGTVHVFLNHEVTHFCGCSGAPL